MPTVYEAQAVFKADSGIPADNACNTFAFQDPDGAGDRAALCAAVAAFYNAAPADPKVGALLSGRLSRAANASTVKLYDLSAAPPRVPIETLDFQLPAAGTVQNMPQEVALCMSFRGQLLSGTNAAQRRGRIYLGPLCKYAAEATVGQEDFPEVDNFTAILDAAQRLHDDAQDAGFDWGIRSRVAGTFTAVSMVWIDNAWDTQRRRGPKASARQERVMV